MAPLKVGDSFPDGVKFEYDNPYPAVPTYSPLLVHDQSNNAIDGLRSPRVTPLFVVALRSTMRAKSGRERRWFCSRSPVGVLKFSILPETL